MYNFLDEMLAEQLDVSVDYYIENIEKTTYYRAQIIIESLMSDDKKIVEKAKRVFNLIK